MLKIVLDQNGNFEITEIEVLSKEKNGKMIGRDKNKKPIYEKLPAIFWTTSEGNFDHRGLDKPKYIDGVFEIKTEGNIDDAKASLKKYAIEYFESVIRHCKGRVSALVKQINNYNFNLLQASETLKTLSGLKL